MPAIAPSILAADFARLGEAVEAAERGGAHRIHLDVMDGHFVPNLSMGPGVVKSLRPVTRLPLEVHLMIEEPARYDDAFIKAGADTIIFHYEVAPDPRPILRDLHSLGKRVGVAIKPGTPVEVLEPYLGELDVVLCMTVEPGFGGQAFMPESLERIRKLRAAIDRWNPDCDLEVDGGIDLTTGEQCARAGANVFVAGTSIYHPPEGAESAVRRMLQQFSAARPV